MSPAVEGCYKRRRIYICIRRNSSIQSGSVYETQMQVRGLLFSITKWEASTLEQIWITIILSLGWLSQYNTSRKFVCSTETCKRHFIIKEEDRVLITGSLWFDSFLWLV